jgi:hypothetical protein
MFFADEGLSSEVVAVYSVADQRLKQAVPFPGGRHVGCYDGTVLLASSNQVIVTLGDLVWLDPFLEASHFAFPAGSIRFL